MNARCYLDIDKGYVHLEEGHIYEDMDGRYFKVKKCGLPYYKFGCAEQIPSPKYPNIVKDFDDHWTEDGISYHNDCGLNLICEVKWDGYYEKYIPYKMSLDVLFARACDRVDNDERAWYVEEDVVAYIRYRGFDNVRFYMMTELPEDIIGTPFGFALTTGKSGKALCKLHYDGEEGGLFNPLIEEDDIHKDHWYHAYKIKLTPVEYEGVVDRWYFSDFVSHMREGGIEIWETE